MRSFSKLENTNTLNKIYKVQSAYKKDSYFLMSDCIIKNNRLYGNIVYNPELIDPNAYTPSLTNGKTLEVALTRIIEEL